jgi:hypothetical protein
MNRFDHQDSPMAPFVLCTRIPPETRMVGPYWLKS